MAQTYRFVFEFNPSITMRRQRPMPYYRDIPLRPRTRVWSKIAVALRDRHRGGDTPADLALDYDIPESVVQEVVAAKRSDQAAKVLARWYKAK